MHSGHSIYVRYCEKGKFAEDVFNEMFSEFMTSTEHVDGDFHEIDLLLTKYLWTCMPAEIVREVNDRNERLWEELRLELMVNRLC